MSNPIPIKIKVKAPIKLNSTELGQTILKGESAYETWLALGNIGTEQEFIDSLKGEQGDPGPGMNDVLLATNHLSEFDTAQKKYNARENLELNNIDGGTFN